jgi:hypothetical protein
VPIELNLVSAVAAIRLFCLPSSVLSPLLNSDRNSESRGRRFILSTYAFLPAFRYIRHWGFPPHTTTDFPKYQDFSFRLMANSSLIRRRDAISRRRFMTFQAHRTILLRRAKAGRGTIGLACIKGSSASKSSHGSSLNVVALSLTIDFPQLTRLRWLFAMC